MKVPSRLSLRLSLASAMISAVLVTSMVLGSVTYLMWRQSSRDGLRDQLRSLVATSALMIDPVQHRLLEKPGDMEGGTYQSLRDRLRDIRALNPQVKYLYTFRMVPGEDKPRFILDTGAPGVDFSPLGMVYEGVTPTIRSAFQAPYTLKVTEDVYSDEYGTWMSAFAPILMPDGTLEAVLGMDVDAQAIADAEFRLLSIVLSLTLGTLFVMALISLWFARRITRPLMALSEDMGRIQAFQLEGHLHAETRIAEVALMATALENMKKGLRSFKKFVPADLVAELIGMQREAVLGTEKRELTVFFCDLENFTTASEKLSPEDLNTLLSSYFETVTATLQAHGATVDKYIGDAVMAFWNAPRPLADHALAAARASLEIQARLSSLLTVWRDKGLPALATRIGLNTGVVLVGNVGQEHRLSYTALGDAVNLASRLESLNKYYGTRILAGEDTLNQLGIHVRWRPVDRVAVKGKTRGTLIGELSSTPPEWWNDYEAAWQAYSASDWRTALDLFAQLAQAPLSDGPSSVLAARCQRFIEQGVPADWEGVWVMHNK